MTYLRLKLDKQEPRSKWEIQDEESWEQCKTTGDFTIFSS